MIKAIAMDVDGVLTDSTFVWGPDGEEFKSFSFRDVMGISLGRKVGLRFALISGENSPLIDRFANKMGIEDVFKGNKDKVAALNSFASKYSLDVKDICFIGDDVNDVAALKTAGLSAVPSDAHPTTLHVATVVARSNGGHGAVREVIDMILSDYLNKNS